MPYEVVCKIAVWIALKPDGDPVSNSCPKASARGVPGIYTSATEAAHDGEPLQAILTIEKKIDAPREAK